MELFHDNINTLKESYNQISGGCGSTLLDITLKAANIPAVAKISEVKAIFFFCQNLKRVPSPNIAPTLRAIFNPCQYFTNYFKKKKSFIRNNLGWYSLGTHLRTTTGTQFQKGQNC